MPCFAQNETVKGMGRTLVAPQRVKMPKTKKNATLRLLERGLHVAFFVKDGTKMGKPGCMEP